MNLSVEHVFMFTLVVCALYYLMGKCGCKEGYEDPKSFCENALKHCLCLNNLSQGNVIKCLDEVYNMVVPSGNGNIKCLNNYDTQKALSEGGGSWFGTAPECKGACPGGWTECETSKTGDGDQCWTGNKVRCAKLP